MQLTKEQIVSAKKMSINQLLDLGFTFEELYEMGEITKEYYSPSGSYEYYIDGTFYNLSEQPLRDPEEFNPHSEGYTPFGDE